MEFAMNGFEKAMSRQASNYTTGSFDLVGDWDTEVVASPDQLRVQVAVPPLFFFFEPGNAALKSNADGGLFILLHDRLDSAVRMFFRVAFACLRVSTVSLFGFFAIYLSLLSYISHKCLITYGAVLPFS